MRADPGTGKTWSMQQLAYTIAEKLTHVEHPAPVDQLEKFDALASPTKPISGNKVAPEPSAAVFQPGGVMLLPLLVPIQQLAKSLGEPNPLLSWVKSEFEGSQRDAIHVAYGLRALIVLLDGVDEAAGKREAVENLVLKSLVPMGQRVVVSSRPEVRGDRPHTMPHSATHRQCRIPCTLFFTLRASIWRATTRPASS